MSATLPLTWTSDPPTVPGWYWRRPKSKLWRAMPVEFYTKTGGVYCPELSQSELNQYDWSGPIPEPQEPQKDT